MTARRRCWSSTRKRTSPPVTSTAPNGVVYRRKHLCCRGVLALSTKAKARPSCTTLTVGHDGTLGGGDANKTPTWDRRARRKPFSLTGSNDFVKIPDSDALDLVGDTLTLSCWVKRSAATSGNLVKKADASNGYRLWITATGALQFEVLIGGTTKTVTSATTIPLNTWKHVAARYDGSELRVFIGGTIEAATTAATGSLVATTEALWLGYYDGTSHHLNGYLDDVSIYDTALSDSAITKLADNEHGRYEYHHTNALGSNIVLTDDDQNVIVRYEYDVFGAVRSETGTSDNPRKFTGKEYESDVKLYYFAARYYDPYTGRFNQRDPAGDGINWYAYVANNPLAFIDPSGLAQRLANEQEMSVFRAAAEFTYGKHNATTLLNFVGNQVIFDDEQRYDGLYNPTTNTITLAAWATPNGPHYNMEGRSLSSANDRSILGTFIHELFHAWEDYTNADKAGVAGVIGTVTVLPGSNDPKNQYKYSFLQLATGALASEQRARVIQEWFIVAYADHQGVAHNFAGFGFLRDAGISTTDAQNSAIASTQFVMRWVNMVRQPLPVPSVWGAIK